MTPDARPAFAAGLADGGVLYGGLNGIAAYGRKHRAIGAWALTLLLGLVYVPLL